LAVLGVLASVISAFYYLKIIKGMYFDEPADNEAFEFTISSESKVILLILMISITFFILYPALLTNVVSRISI
tara:strand:- start:859 stop:1077 length:219 start_codon:yes stop_codon:yes gene_type:complete